MGAPSSVLEGGAFSSAPLDSASLQIHCIDPRQSCFVFRVKRETAPDLPPSSARGIIRHWKEGLARRSAWRGLSPSRQTTYSNHLTIGTNVLEWFCYASAICLRLPPMASRHAVLLNHPESLCPPRLPLASRGLCRGAFRDPGRNVVLLTPSISLRPLQALSYTQITRETPRIPFFVLNSLRTLLFSVSYKSCVCHSYANRRGGYRQFPTWNESLVTCNGIQVLYFQILPDSFALSRSSTLFFSCSSGLFAQNTRGGGRAPVAFLKKNLNSPRILRGINGLRGVAEPWCPHRISSAQIPALNFWSSACHSLPGIQTGQRGNLRFRRSVGHGPACVFHRQEHPVALFLGCSAKRDHHAALAAAAVAYRPYEDGKDIFRHILRRRSAPRKQSFWRDAIHSPLNAGLACRSDPPGNLEQQHQRHESNKRIHTDLPRRNLGFRRSSRPCRIARLRRRLGFCACHGLFGRWSFVRLAKFAGYHRLRVVHPPPPFFLYSHHPSTSLLL